MTFLFKNRKSLDYLNKLCDKPLIKKDLPAEVFEDLKTYDKAFFWLKGKHVFKSIEE